MVSIYICINGEKTSTNYLPQNEELSCRHRVKQISGYEAESAYWTHKYLCTQNQG